FQAEDGIRDFHVTGVQTCALPIWLARSLVSQNTIMAALSGGGAGLGGALFMAADVPVLFTVNLRLIQQIGAAYGFPMRGPEFKQIGRASCRVRVEVSVIAKRVDT